jgi:hypothetical protein
MLSQPSHVQTEIWVFQLCETHALLQHISAHHCQIYLSLAPSLHAQVEVYLSPEEQQATLNRGSVLGSKSLVARLKTSQAHVRNHTGNDITVLVEWTNNSKQLSKEVYSLAVKPDSIIPARMQEFVYESHKVIGTEPFPADRTHSVAFSVGNAKGALITAVSKYDSKQVYCKGRYVPGGKRLTIIPGCL